ncbi:unnamed protein product [Phytophthora fragariaefolia]|uniref:Unnamed protein product n=1 Tax=Phytophthora fragariaefolia TaxID=1490495 RepID=A0A9W7CPX4_9STRA|nr:unnamed protein product [Phytophthora fragariaefolia]
MFGTTRHHVGSIDNSRILYTWFDSGVMAQMQSCINNNLNEASSVSTDELLKFLEMELWLCFYNITPDFFYDKRNIVEYPAAARVMGLARYRAILTALGKPSGLSDESTSTWTALFSHDRDIDQVAELIRRISSSIGFVDGVTIASLDDDLIRLRSPCVDDTGLAHVRNPKKGGIRLPRPRGLPTVNSYALAYRNGLGKVALCYRTLADVGPGIWSYVSRPAHVSELSIDDPDFVRFENGVTQLTAAQRTPEWFILRKVRITGSVAVRGFRAVSRDQRQSVADGRLASLISDNDVKTILGLLGLLRDVRQLTIQLKIKIASTKKQMPVAAFSPDDIALIRSATDQNFVAVMEYKTRTTTQTVLYEEAIVTSHGAFSSINLMTAGFGGLFNDLVPEKSHQVQIVHNVACGGLRDGFLVYASATKIIRVVHVVVDTAIKWTYQSALQTIQDRYMNYIYAPDVGVPRFDFSSIISHCPDRETLLQALSLWRALAKLVQTRGTPLPPGKANYPIGHCIVEPCERRH